MSHLHQYETPRTLDHRLWRYIHNSKRLKRPKAKAQKVLGHSVIQPVRRLNAFAKGGFLYPAEYALIHTKHQVPQMPLTKFASPSHPEGIRIWVSDKPF